MARIARPSDIYRLPEQERAARRPVEPPDGSKRPHRRPPVWLWAAAALAVVLVASGVIGGGGVAPTPTDGAPLVDIVSEDQAIAALALYGAQARTVDDLREQRLIYQGAGPARAAEAARSGAHEVQEALDVARNTENPDPLFTAYVASSGHAETQQAFSGAANTAQTIALLAATHDSIYSGTGAVDLNEAYTSITAVVAGGAAPSAMRSWGAALLEQIERRPRISNAERWRAETERYWAALADSLEPAAVDELRTYVDGLPPGTVAGLRGHPLVGPFLERLERSAQQVSTGTTSLLQRR